MSVVATERMEEALKWAKEKPWVLKDLGAYEEACQVFVQKVSQLDGVIAIGAIPYHGYVDLWTVIAREDWDLDGAIIESFTEVVRKSDMNLLFDFKIVNEKDHFPEEAIVIYQKEA